jgi:chain length determinant protein EpsF
MAALLANAFAQAAIDTNIELKVEPAKLYSVWFEQRSRELRADVEKKQKRLSDFQNSSGIVATDEKLDVETARLTELSTELVSIQGQLQESQSRQRQVNGDNGSIPEVLQSPVIVSIKDSLSQAIAKQQDLAARTGKNHPDYQEAASEVGTLQERLAQETAKIVASLRSTTQVNVRRENDLRAALEAQKQRVLELKHKHDQASLLESDVTAAQRDLDAVTQRSAQSNLESLAQQTNLVLLSTATEPINPSSPKLILNLALGVFLGCVLGIGVALFLEIRNPRLRQDDEIIQLLDIPLLGKMSSMKVAALPVSKASESSPQLGVLEI